MQPTKPSWLPKLIDTNGEPEAVFQRLYAVYMRDFYDDEVVFRGCPIWRDWSKVSSMENDKVFWHLVTKMDRRRGKRLLDTLRARRLPWCKALIIHSDDPAVRSWDYREAHGQVHTYFWLENWDYVVILEFSDTDAAGPVYLLVTAYHVDYESERRDLRKKYNQRI